MAGSEAAKGVSVKIFIEQDQVAVGFFLVKPVIGPVEHPFVLVIQFKYAYQPAGNLTRHIQEVPIIARAPGAFHLQVIPIEMPIDPQGMNDHVIHIHPHRPPPVGIASKHSGGRIPGVVFNGIAVAVILQ
jgi:hypothetical protein